ncbi:MULTISPECIES: hypothetical protein [unclassified Streptomyces]|uniref:hypothetical protein n=1 Tax=unclassified Streptomyces TaxID=2593676 RepID=UPI001660FDED|nr:MULTISPECIES: hypothetical protein [unclassified Streptomyces]MBD0708984.1 hypothetical protein [Streptomyces sp. CBMA291]MBD0716663.1 hypothetical protein [Streptomyces sp. CBMA370]
MAAHAEVPLRRPFRPHGWLFPAVVGVFYGLYATTVARHGGPATLGQLWLGLLSAALLAGGIHALRRYGRAFHREARSAAWGVLTGVAVGFLYSLSGASVFSSSGLGLAFAGLAGVGAYYLFYTHEDAEGHPAPY